jgi:hypothetical protein
MTDEGDVVNALDAQLYPAVAMDVDVGVEDGDSVLARECVC